MPSLQLVFIALQVFKNCLFRCFWNVESCLTLSNLNFGNSNCTMLNMIPGFRNIHLKNFWKLARLGKHAAKRASVCFSLLWKYSSFLCYFLATKQAWNKWFQNFKNWTKVMELLSTHQRTILSKENIKLDALARLKHELETGSWLVFQGKTLIKKLKEIIHNSNFIFVFLDETKLNNVVKLKTSMIQDFGWKSLRITYGKHQRNYSDLQEKLRFDLKENIACIA